MKEYIPAKFQRGIKITEKPVTNKRIAASKKAIRKQIDAYPLFADQFAVELQMTTPEKVEQAAIARIKHIDKSGAAFWKNIRDHDATGWREARKQLKTLPVCKRNTIVEQWNLSQYPKKPCYFLEYLRDATQIKQCALKNFY